MTKVAITINGPKPEAIFPAFIQGSSVLALGDDLVLFFTPYAAPAMVKGELEKMKVEGMPDILDLYEAIVDLDGRMLMCELATKVNKIEPGDLREEIELVGMTTFLVEAKDADLSFSY